MVGLAATIGALLIIIADRSRRAVPFAIQLPRMQKGSLAQPVIVSVGNHMISIAKLTKIARARGASAICSLRKKLQVLIYSKLHDKNHVITY